MALQQHSSTQLAYLLKQSRVSEPVFSAICQLLFGKSSDLPIKMELCMEIVEFNPEYIRRITIKGLYNTNVYELKL